MIDDLKKNCTSAEYLFLYVNDLFTSVEEKLSSMKSSTSESHKAIEISRNKIRRLREELENAVIWKHSERSRPASDCQLDEVGLFALQMLTSTNQQVSQSQLQILLQSKSSDLSAAVSMQIFDAIKQGKISQGHANRLYNYFFR